MKLNELANEILVNQPIKTGISDIDKFGFTDNTLRGNELRLYKDKLMECDEFKDCELLEFIPTPIIQNKEGKPITAQTVLVKDGVKFKGRCFILSISLTPTMYDPHTLFNPVKDGITLTPIMYNEKDFTRYRKIVLPFCVEGFDSDLPLRRAELTYMIEKVLKNPEEYTPQGIRNVMVRGIFETIETEEHSTGMKDNLDIDLSEPPQYSLVFYLKHQNVENTNEVNVSVKSKIMHNSLKEKFLERFDGKSLILEEELNKFLEENGETNGN